MSMKKQPWPKQKRSAANVESPVSLFQRWHAFQCFSVFNRPRTVAEPIETRCLALF